MSACLRNVHRVTFVGDSVTMDMCNHVR
jgi:hypothetical protein